MDYRIKEILEEYGSNPDDFDLERVAKDIEEIIRGTCPHCGADLVSWREMLHEEHRCEVSHATFPF